MTDGVKKILVVEDNKKLQELFVTIFKKEGYEVEVADDGYEGVQKAMSASYDLVTMDLLMPRLNGTEAIKKIKTFKPDAKIAIITAYPKDQNVQVAREIGVMDVLIKPVTAQQIRDLAGKC